MENIQQIFVKTIQENPEDNATRLIYADWLDEHDQPEEADRQRKWKESKQWMVEFAAKCGSTCKRNYDSEGVEGWEEITYEEVIAAGHNYLDDSDYFVQVGSENARSAGHKYLEEYWYHWQILTGRQYPGEIQTGFDNPFSCSC